MENRALTSLYARILHYPRLVLSLIAIACLLLSIKIPNLQIDASSDSLVLQNDQSLATYRQMNKKYETAEFLLLTYSPKADLFSDTAMQDIGKLKTQLETLPGVQSVITYLDVPLLYSPMVNLANFNEGIRYLSDKDIDKNLARQEFRHSPIYRQLITSQDEKTTAIVINLTKPQALIKLRHERDQALVQQGDGLDQKKTLNALNKKYENALEARKLLEEHLIIDVRGLIKQYNQKASIFLGGVPMIVSDMLGFLRSDMAMFGTAILIFIVALLWLIFRQLRWVLLPIATCTATCIAMLGGIAWLGMKLTILSANFIAILLIVTLSITVHLLVRFIEEEKRHPDLDQNHLVNLVMRAMIKPCLFTTLTTMVAFLSLVVSGIKPVIDFGWMMTIAVVIALILAFFLIPCGILLTKRNDHEARDVITNNMVDMLARFSCKHYRKFLFFCLVLFLVSIYGTTKLKVENRFIDNFAEDTEIYQGMLTIDQQLGGTLPLSIIIRKPNNEQHQLESDNSNDHSTDDFFADDDFNQDDFNSDSDYELSYWFSRRGLDDIQKIHEFVASQPDSGKVTSLATIYHVVRDIAGGNVDDIQLAMVKQGMGGAISDTLIKPYLSKDDNETRIAVRVKETSKGLERNQYLESIRQFLTQEMGYDEANITLTGMMVLYNNMLQSLFKSQIQTLGAVFIAIMLMFAVLFRSLSLALIAIMPNLLAAFIVLGGMGFFSIPLDIMTITIAAITLGIGVDNTIHYIYRFRREVNKDGQYLDAIYRCHHSTGLAMSYTSITIVFGFSILMLSNFTPSIYFGLLTSIAMLSALLGALMLLPAMLLFFRPIKVSN